MAFLTSASFDQMDEVNGSGSAGLQEDGSREIEFSCHLGDDAPLKAEWMTSSTASRD